MTKIRYEIDLRAPVSYQNTDRPEPRPISPDDLEALADLMLDAYLGTIDYEGEGYEDAVAEVGSYFGESPLLDHSYALEIDGDVVSAVLVLLHENRPFIGYVMTRAAHKQTGLAEAVTRRALTSLTEAGYDKVVLYITDGNLPSEALFHSLGARPVLEPD